MNDYSKNNLKTTNQLEVSQKGSPDSPSEDDLMRLNIEKLKTQLANLKLENKRKDNEIKDLSVLVRNLISVHNGNFPEAMSKIKLGLENFFAVQNDVCVLKTELLFERKKYAELYDEYNKLKDDISNKQKELMNSKEGMLLIEKSNLENTLIQLSEEVESLSEKNEALLRDMDIKDFFPAYQKMAQELEKKREEFNKLLGNSKMGRSKTSPKKEPASFSGGFKWNCRSGSGDGL